MPFDFIDVTDAPSNTVVTSDPLVMAGLTAGYKDVSIISASGELSVNGGTWGTTGQVVVGDSVRLRVTTPTDQTGAVTVVQFNLQSIGILDWVVTNVNNVLSETMQGSDLILNLVIGAGFIPTEQGDIYDTAEDTAYLLVDEAGTVTDTAMPATAAGVFIAETATGSTTPIVELTITVTDTVEAVGTHVAEVAAFIVTETGSVADTLLPRLAATLTPTDAATVSDTAMLVITQYELTNAVGASDTALPVVSFATLVAEVAEATDTVTPRVIALAVVADAVDAVDDSSTVAVTGINIHGGTAVVWDDPIFENPVELAWVINARTQAVTRWEQLPISQMHDTGETVFGIAPNAVYAFGASSAAAEINTGVYDFGTPQTKQLDVGYTTYESNYPLEIDAIAVVDGVKQRTTYRPARMEATGPRQTRVVFGRGRASVHWSFAIRNDADHHARIQSLRVVPAVTTRRI